MPLSDDELLAQLQEMLVVDALNLEPEQHTVVCTTLTTVRWLKLLCKAENKQIADISAELVIKKLTGKEVQPDDFATARKKVSAQLLCSTQRLKKK